MQSPDKTPSRRRNTQRLKPAHTLIIVAQRQFNDIVNMKDTIEDIQISHPAERYLQGFLPSMPFHTGGLDGPPGAGRTGSIQYTLP